MNVRQPDGSVPAGAPASSASLGPPAGSTAAQVAPAGAAEAQAAGPSRAEMIEAVMRANRQMAAVAPALEFTIDPDTKDVVIRLVDRHDQQVLRQVPAPEMLAIARALDRMQSLLMRIQA